MYTCVYITYIYCIDKVMHLLLQLVEITFKIISLEMLSPIYINILNYTLPFSLLFKWSKLWVEKWKIFS